MTGATPDAAAGALEGVRIADFSRVLAAPYATMLLADLGAEVVKVERPDGGDETRSRGGRRGAAGSRRTSWRQPQQDLPRHGPRVPPAGLDEARELVADCDVVVENFRTGTMERFGLGYDQLRGRRSPGSSTAR